MARKRKASPVSGEIMKRPRNETSNSAPVSSKDQPG